MGRLLLVFCLLLSLPVHTAALSTDASKKLTYELQDAFEADDTLGAAVVLLQDGREVFSYTQGLAVWSERVPVEEETLFRVASASKMITAVGVMVLVERGELSLDEDIGCYLGYPVRNPAYPEERLTLRQLLSHTAGILHNGDYALRETNQRKGLQEMLVDGGNVTANFAERRPGEAYEYSNFGAGIVGSIIESVTGQSLQAFFEEAVFDPLGIEAYFHPAYVPEGKPMAVHYRAGENLRSWDPYRVAEAPFDPACNPDDHYDLSMGNVLISAAGLGRIGALLCQGGTLDGVRILQRETVEEMFVKQSGVYSVFGTSEQGLGITFRDDFLRGRTLYGHQGVLGDWICDVYFDPQTGGVVAMVTNSTLGKRSGGTYALVADVLRAGFSVLDGL